MSKPDYEPLTITIEKFRGNRDGLKSIFNVINEGITNTQNNQFTLKLTLKEISVVSKDSERKQP